MLPDYSSLSDAELNAKVSELIMDGKQGKWISDWNHTMEVVGIMKSQLFSGRKKYREAWEKVTGFNMSEALTSLNQKDICLAALLVVSDINK